MCDQVQFPSSLIPRLEKKSDLTVKIQIFAIFCFPSIEFSLLMVLPVSSLPKVVQEKQSGSACSFFSILQGACVGLD